MKELIYKQVILNIQQQKDLEIDSSEFQPILNRQNNQKLNINNDKISGAADLQMIGLNNLAKVEGIKEVAEDNSKVRFIAVEDDKTTLMCDSLNNQEFYINKENVFNRYYGETQKELTVQRIRCNGLVLGLNLPPIQHHFHYCRSTIMYLPPVEKQEKTEYNNVDYIRKNNYTNSKNLDRNIKKAINKLPEKIRKIINDTTFEISKNNSYYDRKNNVIYLLSDSNEYEILHEIGHAIETKLDLLHDKKYIKLKTNGVYITEKLANTLKIKKGDTITIKMYENQKKYQVKVVGLTRDPQNQQLNTTKEFYENLNLTYKPDTIYTNKNLKNTKNIKGVEIIQSINNIKEGMNSLLETTKTMISILIVVSAGLAIVIIYNLGILSFTEQEYQFATLKVLGFKNKQIKRIFEKQNIWLTIIAILIGMPLGYILTESIFTFSLGENYDFNADIKLISYLLSFLGILLVSIIVNKLLAKKVNKIDMVSSLKSNE